MLALLIPYVFFIDSPAGIGGIAVGVFLWTINGGGAATKGAFIAAGGLAVLTVSVAGLVL